MSFIDKIIGKQVTDVISEVKDVVDVVSTTDEEKLALKNKISEIVTTALVTTASYQRDVLVQELQGSKLQRNWRPILMLCFGFIIMYRYFFAPVFGLPPVELPDQFWELLNVSVGGYVICRSVEKVTDKITKNIDLPLVKKKNRKLEE